VDRNSRGDGVGLRINFAAVRESERSMPESNQNSHLNRLGPAVRVPMATVRPKERVIDVEAGGLMLDIPSLVRKYIWLAIPLVLFGTGCGFFAVAFFTPVYKARARVEVRPPNSSVLAVSTMGNESGQVDLGTEAQLIMSTTFLRKVVQHLELESIPATPVQTDVFAKLRRRMGLGADDDTRVDLTVDGVGTERVPRALAMALRTVAANRVEYTRILEITCESSNPEFAADFLNALANEYIAQNQQIRLQTVQATTQWLSQQLEEYKNKMQEADKRLQEFVQRSGTSFESSDSVFSDTKLYELQERLNTADADLISKQTRYEAIKKSPPESLPDLLDDASMKTIQTRIADLKREETGLLTTLTPEHSKVKRVELQIAGLQSDLKKAADVAVARVTADYEVAKQSRDRLRAAYSSEASRLSSQGGKEAQHAALKRESDSARQAYNTLLLQSNQANIMGSVPVNNVWLVDPSVPPGAPSKPKPPIIIGAGAIFGLGIWCGIVFLREGVHQRIGSPGQARQMFNLPQLGVIPSLGELAPPRNRLLSLGRGPVVQENAALIRAFASPNDVSEGSAPALNELPLYAESFRVTLASLIRGAVVHAQPQVILVTSPGPREGKTTITSNLGIALAETGRRVLILDADFRRPNLHCAFAVSNDRGLADLLGGEEPVTEYPSQTLTTRTSVPNLNILTNGSRLINIATALYSPRLSDLFARFRREFDTILIDAPPLLHIADARVMSTMADGVILVLRSGVTDRESTNQALELLRADEVPILGTILNDWKGKRPQVYGYYQHPTKSTAV
jgi:polysaccharide biosynthesis transport protein